MSRCSNSTANMRWSTTVRWPRNSDDSMITGGGTPSNSKSPPENVEGITGNQIFGISSGNGKLTLSMSNPYSGESPFNTPQRNKATTLPVLSASSPSTSAK